MIAEALQMSGRGYPHGRLDHAAEHYLQRMSASSVDHFERFKQSTGFRQFDDDTIYVGMTNDLARGGQLPDPAVQTGSPYWMVYGLWQL